MAKKRQKDMVLSLYANILEEIKENEKYNDTSDAKKELSKLQSGLLKVEAKLERGGHPKSDIKDMTADQRNQINKLTGKDYYFSVSDGFKTFPLKKSDIEKMGEETPIFILTKFKENVIDDFNYTILTSDMTREQQKAKEDAYARLIENIDGNIEILERDGDYEYDDYYDNIINDDAYPIFIDVVSTIIRINI